jgi:uncharacterized membrane protein
MAKPVKPVLAILFTLLLALAVLLIFAPILYPPPGSGLAPWSSDTLGHLLKVDLLRGWLAKGVLYPDLLPQWYLGQQMMRYHPPLPYYLLAGLSWALGSELAAANWFIALSALAGGLGWLLYRRWIGWLPALLGGLLFTFLPDNLRVALAEGNLPRVLATAVLPYALYFLLRSLEDDAGFRSRLGLALCMALVLFCHAMMAAIYAVCFSLLAFLLWAGRAIPARRFTLAVASLALGILLSGWWLLPSLTGGITELSTAAMTEALAVFSLPHYLNPLARLGDPETVYVGAALLVCSGLACALSLRRTRNPEAGPGISPAPGSGLAPGFGPAPIALALTGLCGVLVTTPGFNQVFNALPLHNLLWPLRFLGAASLMLLLGLLWALSRWPRRYTLLAALVLALVAADGAGSLFLIKLRPLRVDIPAVSRELASSQGWREATLDLSRLGSAPSLYFTSVGGREQVFGWAYQGARAARTVSALNDALQLGQAGYLADRLSLLGVDDVALLKGLPYQDRVLPALAGQGFRLAYRGDELDLYHRDGAPRLVAARWPALGIGRGAQNLAYLFPQIIVGTSPRVDDYSLDELCRYQTVVLSGFSWKKQPAAEELVRQAAGRGVRVLVDLTGSPPDPYARIPHFLGVWGEQIILGADPLTVQDGDQTARLLPFLDEAGLWHTHILQGLEHETWSSTYLGQRVVLAGYDRAGDGEIWFVGLNLPYHALLAQDAAAVHILADLLRLPAGGVNSYQAVPLQDYQAGQDGYRFRYVLEEAQRLLLPVAAIEGLAVAIDGSPAPVSSSESLVLFDAPAGEHQVSVTIRQTWIYKLGWLATALGALGIGALYFTGRRK